MATVIKKKEDNKKLDEFISTSEKLTAMIVDNWRGFSALLSVIILFLFVFVYLWNSRTEERNRMFLEISKIGTALNDKDTPVVNALEQIVDKFQGVHGSAYAEFLLAKHLLSSGDSAKGEIMLKEIGNSYPDSLFAELAELELGYSLEFSGKNAQAMDYFKGIIARDVSFAKAEAYLGLGRCLEVAEKKDEARNTFKEFIQKFPGYMGHEYAKMRIRSLES